MTALRKWWKLALAILGLVIAGQIGASLLVRTHRVHHFLVAQLSKAFGRPVEVKRFEAQLLPTPKLDAAEITVGEDPAFGNEYFFVLRVSVLGCAGRGCCAAVLSLGRWPLRGRA
jgi:hypothetical protein